MTDAQMFDSVNALAYLRQTISTGFTIKMAFDHSQATWNRLKENHSGRCLIVEQKATRVKHQLVSLYVVDVIRFLKTFDTIPLMPIIKEDASLENWKLDCLVLNLSCRDIKDHEDLFTKAMVSLFGVPTKLIQYGLNPTYQNLYDFVNIQLKTAYDVPIALADKDKVTLEDFEQATKEMGYDCFVKKA